MDDESLQDKRYFDYILVVVNLAPFLLPVLQQILATRAAKSLKVKFMDMSVVKAVAAQLLSFLGYEEAVEIADKAVR